MSNLSNPALVRAAVAIATKGNVSKFARLIGVGANTVFRWRKGSPMDGATVTLLQWITLNPESFPHFLALRAQAEATETANV